MWNLVLRSDIIVTFKEMWDSFFTDILILNVIIFLGQRRI